MKRMIEAIGSLFSLVVLALALCAAVTGDASYLATAGPLLGMAFLSGGEYRGLTRNVRAVFYGSLKAAVVTNFVNSIFLIVQSNNISETFAFVRGIPKMRHWVGDRVMKGFGWAQFTIEKKDWEATIVITRDDLLFDRLGFIRPNIEALGSSFPRHYVDFVIDLLANGFTRLAYDGQYFFDTDHGKNPAGDSYSNKTTAAFSRAAWEVAETAPRGLQDPESGEDLEVLWTDIYFGQNAQAEVDNVFNTADYVDGGGNVRPNRHYGKIPKERQHLLLGLGASGKWFLTDESKPIKPLILQIVKGVSFEAFDGDRDWNMWNRKEAVYGIDSIDNAGYGFWELAYGGTAGE
jgi:phage major head subunit gpT-like protein